VIVKFLVSGELLARYLSIQGMRLVSNFPQYVGDGALEWELLEPHHVHERVRNGVAVGSLVLENVGAIESQQPLLELLAVQPRNVAHQILMRQSVLSMSAMLVGHSEKGKDTHIHMHPPHHATAHGYRRLGDGGSIPGGVRGWVRYKVWK
jgi:hypothetical protein